MPTYAPAPVTFVRGAGTELWDDTGKRYLDLLSGLAVTSLGHSHPAVADALAEQSRTLLHVSNLFRTEPGEGVAATLDLLVGDGTPAGGQVFFANSGAEANECAIKLARKYGGRGRHVVVSAFGSFHGRTLATLHATGQPAKHEAFQPLPEGFRHVVWDDLDDLERTLDPTVAAVLLEPVQGEGGVNPASAGVPAGRPAALRRAGHPADRRRGADRSGAHRAVVRLPARRHRARRRHHGQGPRQRRAHRRVLGPGRRRGAFEPGDHATTYGGQPLATAAAAAVLATMQAIDAPGLAAKRGAEVVEAVTAVPGVAGVRGLGLLVAVELVEGIDAKAVTLDCLEAGLVVNGITPTALRLAPPLTISEAELDEAVTILAGVLARHLDGSA